MSTSNKLKAYVRFDGSGRVVPSSLILARFKPKVGNYKEIDAYECCNDVSTTTTTTTQGGGVTPTAFVKSYWLSPGDACNTTLYGSLIFYSASPVLQPGVAIFTDAALTIPVTFGYVINVDMFVYPRLLVGVGGVLSVVDCSQPTTTTTTTQLTVYSFIGRAGSTSSNACNGINTDYYTTGPLMSGIYPQDGNVIYYDVALTQPVTDLFLSSPGLGWVWNCTNGLLSNQQVCFP